MLCLFLSLIFPLSCPSPPLLRVLRSLSHAVTKVVVQLLSLYSHPTPHGGYTDRVRTAATATASTANKQQTQQQRPATQSLLFLFALPPSPPHVHTAFLSLSFS